ncbi:hypothetical protein IAT38_001603 [Cryptococcus sp. DSM 104549]
MSTNGTSTPDLAQQSSYGYIPTAWVCIAFTAAFSVIGVVHILQAIRYKYWIVFASLSIGTALEIMGWAARYWSSQNVLARDAFLMQIVALIIAPVFLSAWCYTILGLGINALGPQFSLLRPKLYLAIFISCDIISLILQAVGGGWAASADGPVPKTPTNIMVIGIVFQLASMIVFSLLTLDFLLRASRGRPYRRIEPTTPTAATFDEEASQQSATRLRKEGEQSYESFQVQDGASAGSAVTGWWWVMAGTAVCSLMIIIRGIYRTVELIQGWDGYLIEHEVYQDTLDGIPMFIALVAIAIFHPGFFLPRRRGWKNAQ